MTSENTLLQRVRKLLAKAGSAGGPVRKLRR